MPIGPLTTYRVGGPAALACRVEDETDLEVLRTAVPGSGVPVLVVGRGSNLLVTDAGFPGLVVLLGERFAEIDLDGTDGPGRGRRLAARRGPADGGRRAHGVRVGGRASRARSAAPSG